MNISLDKAALLLKEGHVVAVPTETVYGLAASIASPRAIEAIFALKKRPQDNPLIIHVESIEQILPYVKEVPFCFDALAEAFWPGPLTMIIPIIPSAIPSNVRAGLMTAGFRIPSHPSARQLLKAVGPLAMPSANLSGRPSATSADHVHEDFGVDFPVLEGSVSDHGVESTILYYKEGEWMVARLGALPPEEIEKILGYVPPIIEKGKKVICPGQQYRHYAPKAKLLMDGKSLYAVDCLVGFGDRQYPEGKRVVAWGVSTDAKEVAANLYAVLRKLDQEGVQAAWVDMDFPKEGLWITIAERLHRAAVSS